MQVSILTGQLGWCYVEMHNAWQFGSSGGPRKCPDYCLKDLYTLNHRLTPQAAAVLLISDGTTSAISPMLGCVLRGESGLVSWARIPTTRRHPTPGSLHWADTGEQKWTHLGWHANGDA